MLFPRSGTNLRLVYKGQGGYLFFAQTVFNGDLKKAFEVADFVLGSEELKILEWKKYSGSIKQFNKDRELLILGDRVRPEFMGHAGFFYFVEHNIK